MKKKLPKDVSKLGIVVRSTPDLIQALTMGYKEITWIDTQETTPQLRKALEDYAVKRKEYTKTVFEKITDSSNADEKKQGVDQ